MLAAQALGYTYCTWKTKARNLESIVNKGIASNRSVRRECATTEFHNALLRSATLRGNDVRLPIFAQPDSLLKILEERCG